MAITRRVQYLSESRLDIPDMRSIESAVSADFDLSAMALISGPSTSYVVRGFTIPVTGSIGGASNGLQLVVGNGAILHTQASQSGSYYMVPTGTANIVLNSATNPKVSGAFTPNAINYVGIDFTRAADPATNVTRYIWNESSGTETTTTAPSAQTLDIKVIITTSVWAATTLPIAIVVTDSNNNVISITDARNEFCRLGQGGSSPNALYSYPWAQGRSENPNTSSSSASDPFNGGDKNIGSLKEWMDAVMTSFKEIKGTTYWYSVSSSGSLESLREDLGNTVITGRGHIAHGVLPADGKTPTAAGQLNWDQDINIRVIGSEIAYTLVANPTSNYITLTEDKVAYINLVRNVLIGPNLVLTNSSPTVVSVGGISWTGPLQAGDWIKAGSETTAGYYQIQSVDSLSQVTLVLNYAGASTGVIGATAQYAFGSYSAVASPSSNRHIYITSRGTVPEGQDTFWLFLRSDNGGTTPRVYIKFLGSELEQGVDRDISDQTPIELLQYIGAPSEGSFAPEYVAALTPSAVPEKSTITVGAATSVTAGQYFFINSSGNARKYYVWFKKASAGTDPAPGGTNASIEVDLSGTETAAQVAALLVSALNATFANDFIAVQSTVTTSQLTVTNSSSGVAAAPVNFNVPAPFAIVVTQSGTGVGNTFVNDGDNLTLAIKKLDEAMGNLAAALDEPSYDETVVVVASGATPPLSINGPVTVGTLITLPNNSRLGNVAQKYTVGKGTIQVYLNGVFLHTGFDYIEYGTANTSSNQIQINIPLAVFDHVHFRIAGLGGGAGGGGGEQGPPGPPGQSGPAGADAVGGPVAISTKTSSYTVQLSDNVLLANCAGGNLVFTLPAPSTATGHVWYMKKVDSSSNSMTIQAPGSFTIDGLNTQLTTLRYESFTIMTDGSQFFIF